MPPPLGGRSLLLAGCLRLVSLAARNAEGVSYDSIPQRSTVTDVVQALHRSTVPQRRPLPGPSYALVFPVVAAVLRCPQITPLHDEALAVLGLHVAPEQDIPRGESLELLYAVLGTIPAYRCGQGPRRVCAAACSGSVGLQASHSASHKGIRLAVSFAPGLCTGAATSSVCVQTVLQAFELHSYCVDRIVRCVLTACCRDRVQPLLRSLCSGVGEPELMAAVSGLLAGSAAVRASTLTALPHVPTLAEGLPPESGEVLAVMALARHDADEDNAAAAEALWTQVRACTCISMRGVAAHCAGMHFS
jgi:hypothetical protein